MAGGTLKSSMKGLAGALDGSGGVGSALKQPKRYAQAAAILVKAGVIDFERPDKSAGAAAALFNWKLTPAGGFTVSAIRFPDQPAIIDEKGSLTFAEVDKRTNALAHSMAEAGIGPDSSVAIMCRDHRWFIEATVALSKLGATALFYNTQFAGPQLKEVTEREDPDGIVYDEEFAEVVDEAAGKRKRWVAWHDDESAGDDTVEQLIEAGDDADLDSPDKPGKVVLLTSGSTGTPKGASRGEPDAVEPVIALFSRIPLRARQPTFFAAPLFHAWGFLQFNMGLILSSTYVLRRKFDPEATLAAIAEHKATALVIVPVMMQRILELDDEERQKHDLRSLRVVAASGGALSGDLAKEWMDEFDDNLYNLYGSTEVAWAAIATPEDMRDAPGTSGKAPPGTSLRILESKDDDEEEDDGDDGAGDGEDGDRKELPAGESGEIFVANEMLIEGYTGDEDEGEEMVDGYMGTGDLGHLDEEGRLFVEGRADDMIVSGGENVYPEEVEESLEGHSGVSEAAVIGVEDEEFGERLKAFVVKDGEVSEDDLKSHVKENLADYKVPREIEFIDELPRKPQGKVDKQKLKESQEDEEGDSGSEGSNSGDSESASG